MVLVKPPRGERSLGTLWIALALTIAAFLGAAAGLVWQSAGLGSAEDEQQAEDQPAEAPEASSSQ